MNYSEKDIEKAVKEAMNKVDERGIQAPTEAKRLVLETPYGTFQSGSIFKAKTSKGGHNYILFLMELNGDVYWIHGDRAKKCSKKHFMDNLEGGDLEYVPRDKADPERLSLSVLGLMAMANGLSFNDYMKVIWNHGEGTDANQYQKDS